MCSPVSGINLRWTTTSALTHHFTIHLRVNFDLLEEENKPEKITARSQRGGRGVTARVCSKASLSPFSEGNLCIMLLQPRASGYRVYPKIWISFNKRLWTLPSLKVRSLEQNNDFWTHNNCCSRSLVPTRAALMKKKKNHSTKVLNYSILSKKNTRRLKMIAVVMLWRQINSIFHLKI